jgi:hypothetical protein
MTLTWSVARKSPLNATLCWIVPRVSRVAATAGGLGAVLDWVASGAGLVGVQAAFNCEVYSHLTVALHT